MQGFFIAEIFLIKYLDVKLMVIKNRTNIAIERLFPWLLFSSLVLYMLPYGGIRHDAVLYLAQILKYLSPDVFKDDLFFVAGSQANFTLFPQMFAPLVEQFGAGPAFLWLTVLFRIIFFFSSWVLLRALLPNRWVLPALLALAVISGRYGGFGLMRYAEGFFTARIISESLTLLALAIIVTWPRRLWLGGLCLCLAALLHPLQALSGALVGWCWLVLKDRRWLHLLWLSVPALIAGYLNVSPFSGLFQVMKGSWLSEVVEVNGLVFVSQWRPVDWCVWLADAFILLLVWKRAEPESNLRRAALAILLSLLVACVVSLLLADLLKLVLPIGLQLWRIQWLAHWLVVASLPWLLWGVFRTEDRIRFMFLLCIAAFGMPVPIAKFAYAVPILAIFYLTWPWLVKRSSKAIHLFVYVGLIVALIVSLINHIYTSVSAFNQTDKTGVLFRVDVILANNPFLIGAIVTGLVVLFQKGSMKTQIGLYVVALLFFLFSVSHWDSRSPWTRAIESASAVHSPFRYKLEPDAQVYWHDADAPYGPWLVLGRASFVSVYQLAGQLFNEGTASLGEARRKRMTLLDFQSAMCQMVDGLNGRQDSCWLGAEALEETCTNTPETGHLDYLVLPYKQPQKALGSWEIVDPKTKKTIVTYRLYSCKSLLNEISNQPKT